MRRPGGVGGSALRTTHTSASLQAQLIALQAQYDGLLSQYNALQGSYNTLQSQYNTLQSSYNSLNALHVQQRGLAESYISTRYDLVRGMGVGFASAFRDSQHSVYIGGWTDAYYTGGSAYQGVGQQIPLLGTGHLGYSLGMVTNVVCKNFTISVVDLPSGRASDVVVQIGFTDSNGGWPDASNGTSVYAKSLARYQNSLGHVSVWTQNIGLL